MCRPPPAGRLVNEKRPAKFRGAVRAHRLTRESESWSSAHAKTDDPASTHTARDSILKKRRTFGAFAECGDQQLTSLAGGSFRADIEWA